MNIKSTVHQHSTAEPKSGPDFNSEYCPFALYMLKCKVIYNICIRIPCHKTQLITTASRISQESWPSHLTGPTHIIFRATLLSHSWYTSVTISKTVATNCIEGRDWFCKQRTKTNSTTALLQEKSKKFSRRVKMLVFHWEPQGRELLSKLLHCL